MYTSNKKEIKAGSTCRKGHNSYLALYSITENIYKYIERGHNLKTNTVNKINTNDKTYQEKINSP